MNSPLVHLCILGALLFLGVILRTKIRFLKTYFIPASLIAGLIGLSLGPYGFRILPNEVLQTFSSLPQMLITIVFAPMLIGVRFPKTKDMIGTVGPQLLFGYIGVFLLISTPLIVTALIVMPIWKVDSMFGTLIEIGFVGGHGTAGGMAEVFSSLGWSEGGALGLTTATIGLFIGIICGMIIINHGVRSGQASFIKTESEIKNTNISDIVPRKERQANTYLTINKDVVEPLAFHFGVIALAILTGLVILVGLETLTGLNLPLFPMAMIGGLIVQSFLSQTEYVDAIDVGTLKLIQGLALELLIISAISTIQIPVVVTYALPLLVVSLVALCTLLFHFYILGPRLFKSQWFEHSIVNFGGLAGVTAVGLMLLRTVDPDIKSEAVTAYAMRSPFLSPIAGGGLLTSIMPQLVSSYGAFVIGSIFFIVSILLVILARVLGFWTVRK